MVNFTGQVFGLAKASSDNVAATIIGDQQKIRDLTARLLAVIFQRKRQQLEVTAAQRRFDAAQARIRAAGEDLDALQKAISANVNDLEEIAGIVEALLTALGRLGELVVRNVFLAARALDILQFSDHAVVVPPPPGAPPVPAAPLLAAQLPLDFGVVHPEAVADAVLELRRGGVGADRQAHATAALSLVGDLVTNWAQVPEWQAFKDRANNLGQELSPLTAWVPLHDPAVIATLQQTGRAGFLIRLGDLPPAALELRIKRVIVTLVGATAPGGVPSMVGQLTHGGYANVRRRDGAELLVDGPALTDVVTVTTISSPTATPMASEGLPGAADLPVFFGRSPSTHWQLDLTGPLAQGLQLDGLTALQLGIDCFGLRTP